MSYPGSEASVLEGWIPASERRGYISIHTTDGKVCHAEGDYTEAYAVQMIRNEAKNHPEGVLVSVRDGFRFFPMIKVSHITFREDLSVIENYVSDAPA